MLSIQNGLKMLIKMFNKFRDLFKKPITTLLLCIVLVSTATLAFVTQGSLIGGNQDEGCMNAPPLSDVPTLVEVPPASAGDS